MIDLEKMAKEHEQLFPMASLESQIWKLEEELKEFKESKTVSEMIKEGADVVIVCAGIYRWCPVFAQDYANSFRSDAVEDEVNRKWQVNLNRKWEWNGKTYKHVGKDGNE